MFREASPRDLLGLLELERIASLSAHGHIFTGVDSRFPDDDVLARWTFVLEDPATVTLVLDGEQHEGLIAYATYDDHSLRHLAVHPDHWGQRLATEAVDLAVNAMDLRGCTCASLWCLEENHRARRLYGYLGWRPTGRRRAVPRPPHPMEIEYARLIVESDR